MRGTLIVDGIECRTIVIEGLWHVIMDGNPCRLYRSQRKNKRRTNGVCWELRLRTVCHCCNKEFFGRLDNLRRYCSYNCSMQDNQTILRTKFISISNDTKLKKKAISIIGNGVASRRIIKPRQCSHCKSTWQVEAHHPDYNKPNEVIWLCKSCHSKLHNRQDINGELVVYNVQGLM